MTLTRLTSGATCWVAGQFSSVRVLWTSLYGRWTAEAGVRRSFCVGSNYAAACGMGRRRCESEWFMRRLSVRLDVTARQRSRDTYRSQVIHYCVSLWRIPLMPEETKVCRYNWHSAGSLDWPFTMLKYEYIFQIKYTEAILSNSTQKLLWLPKCWLQFKN